MLKIREFSKATDSVESLLELYAVTYGQSQDYAARWEWEYEENPRREDLKIFIATDGKRVVGATTRLPAPLLIKEKRYMGAFNCNSMVHPDYRGQGVMQQLYRQSAVVYPVLLSKGTAVGMYRLLKKMGYQDLEPNTVMTTVLSPISWLRWRLGLYKPSVDIDTICASKDFKAAGLKIIERFDEDFDEFFERFLAQVDCCLVKNREYMNWRYFGNPDKKYKVIYHSEGKNIGSIVILRQTGSSLRIVDLLSIDDSAVLRGVLSALKKCAKQQGFIKMACWTSDSVLRRTLRRKGFVERNETPHFSAFWNRGFVPDLRAMNLSFFEGDGDSEYLS